MFVILKTKNTSVHFDHLDWQEHKKHVYFVQFYNFGCFVIHNLGEFTAKARENSYHMFSFH